MPVKVFNKTQFATDRDIEYIYKSRICLC